MPLSVDDLLETSVLCEILDTPNNYTMYYVAVQANVCSTSRCFEVCKCHETLTLGLQVHCTKSFYDV